MAEFVETIFTGKATISLHAFSHFCVDGLMVGMVIIMKKYTFPEPMCLSCQYRQTVGDFLCETHYCNGFKRKKPRRFRTSDPRFKTPQWCPKRISPPICRIYGFADEESKWMELMRRHELGQNNPHITPFPHHYKLRAEVPLGMTARRFFDETQADYLSNIFPPDVNVTTGEIIEIDDGLQPYFFYVNSDAAVTPLHFFRMQNSKESDSK